MQTFVEEKTLACSYARVANVGALLAATRFTHAVLKARAGASFVTYLRDGEHDDETLRALCMSGAVGGGALG